MKRRCGREVYRDLETHRRARTTGAFRYNPLLPWLRLLLTSTVFRSASPSIFLVSFRCTDHVSEMKSRPCTPPLLHGVLIEFNSRRLRLRTASMLLLHDQFEIVGETHRSRYPVIPDQPPFFPTLRRHDETLEISKLEHLKFGYRRCGRSVSREMADVYL